MWAKGSECPGPSQLLSLKAQSRRKTSEDGQGRPKAIRRNRRGPSCPRRTGAMKRKGNTPSTAALPVVPKRRD